MAKKISISLSVEEKLKSLYNLQIIDSQIDQLRIVRGELPVEIQDLEDEIVRINTRLDKFKDEKDDLKLTKKSLKESIKNSDELIVKYKSQLDNIKNNREFVSLTKEIEFQELEKELSEKKINEFKAKILMKDEVIVKDAEKLEDLQENLKEKKSELSEITSETEKEENELIAKSDKFQKKIDQRLLESYKRIRSSVRNGLSLVSVDRDACGGCYNQIPPQRQLDIKMHKKIIVCEHCGRILVDSNILSK
tara:strand:+ start:26850 stop:27599 length:750 start_codon:yes stop_codon:yes gene_type:complete